MKNLDMDKYVFYARNQLNTVDEKYATREYLNGYFMSDANTLYVTDGGDHLIGIVTLGDYPSKHPINRTYKSIESDEPQIVMDFFNNHKGIFEAPVIKKGVFVGACRATSGTQFFQNKYDKHVRMKSLKEQMEEIIEYLDSRGIQTWFLRYPHVDDVITDPDEIEKYHKLLTRPDAKLGFCEESFLKHFFGEEYYRGIGRDFQHDFQLISGENINGRTIIRDTQTGFFTVKDRKRYIDIAPLDAPNRIFLFGRCFVFGAYVSDKHTIGYYLQSELNDKSCGKYQVNTIATLGQVELSPFYCEELSDDDTIFYIYSDEETTLILDSMESTENIHHCVMFSPFLSIESITDNLYNCLTHHNHILNQSIARYISGIVNSLPSLPLSRSNRCHRYAKQDYYIDPDIRLFFNKMRREYEGIVDFGKRIGAVVMNCNPFTNGHKGLVLTAIEQVDYLFVFVVEEDRSFIKFQDRFEMVKRGLEGIPNVIIVPSGDYIISQKTFAQYFEKEKEIDVIHNMDYDIRVFAETACRELNISTRFVGEEPTDVVTREYNRTMHRLLPHYNVKCVEIPRFTTNEGTVISATEIRRYLQQRDWKKIQELVPSSTLDYLKEKAKYD